MPLSKEKYEEWKILAKKTRYHKKRYKLRRKRGDKWACGYSHSHPKTKEDIKKYRKYARENLTDWYIKNLINSHFKLKFSEIPLEMVEFKRNQLILFNLIKKAKGFRNGRTY